MAKPESQLLLWQREPDWVAHTTGSEYAKAAAEKGIAGYTKLGGVNEYRFRHMSTPLATTSGIMSELEEANPDRRLRILDIGAGLGSFVLRQIERGHDAQALSAYDFRPAINGSWKTSQSYLLGDAHYLQRIEGVRPPYDLIVSRWCLRHLVNPLSVVEQAATAISVGGMLALDEFYLMHDPQAEAPPYTNAHLITDLQSAGFIPADPSIEGWFARAIEATQPSGGKLVPNLILRRVAAGAVYFGATYGNPTHSNNNPSELLPRVTYQRAC